MSVLLFAEHAQGSLKKSTFEAATYAYDLAQRLGTEVVAASVGQISEEELAKLGTYGISKVYAVSNDDLNSFVNTAYASAVSAIAKSIDVKAVVLSESYNGKAIAPRIAVKLKAAVLPSVIALADPETGFDTQRMSYSGKGM
ncbi:MAG: electron transfer flavoprotein subunit alpha/FixB family protein, partial [Bacteroidota bacterium]